MAKFFMAIYHFHDKIRNDELELEFNSQVFMATYHFNERVRKNIFDEVPGDTEDFKNRITYKRDMKSTTERVLTNIWQPARELYFVLLLHGIVHVFRIYGELILLVTLAGGLV